MSRKSIILCLAALAVLALGTAAAVAVLYSGSGQEGDMPDDSRYTLLPAVPADAVAVCCLSRAERLGSSAFSGFPMPEALLAEFAEGRLDKFSGSPLVLSLHYSGKLTPLYVFDAGTAREEPSGDAEALMEFCAANGFYSRYVNCSHVSSEKRISGRSVVLAAETETLVKSAERHLEQSLSVTESAGFAEAAANAEGDDVIFLSNARIKPVFTAVFSRGYFKDVFGTKANETYSAYAGFLGTFADWTVFSVKGRHDGSLALCGTPVYADDASAFMSVMEKSDAGVSSVSSVLPSYTFFAFSLPAGGSEAYMKAYEEYLDSRQELQAFRWEQSLLAKRDTVAPSDFVSRLGIKEVASASFVAGKGMMKVNLAKVSKEDMLLFRGTEVTSYRNYVPSVHKYAFSSHLASVFGKEFRLKDESCFTYMNGWLVSGSREAIEEYVSGRALEYSLKEYFADAGKDDLLGGKPARFVAYLNLTGDRAVLEKLFTKEFYGPLSSVCGAEYCPAVFRLTKGKKGMVSELELLSLSFEKMKAPAFERDTVVTVPAGPFKVKNSGTGRTNLFYQNAHKALCLQEEDGKGIWGVPFGQDICGTVHSIDYYANGKLQFLFGAGSKIYLIDRLGRFVSGFPVDLGKEIMVGPDAYDFGGAGKYNVVVLHKDNTVEMYNLKGQKPASWKGIRCDERIKALPERLDAGGRTYWVIRTSVQTLIFPFYGGAPLTGFKGDQMILPGSTVTVRDGSSADVECYDGKVRTVKLT